MIRGLHYQIPPYAQSKLVSVLKGKVLDIVIDIRKGSPNFGKHLAIELSGINQKQLFIPRGFAHGYSCLSETAFLSYKVDNYYNKDSEASIAFDDLQLGIDWKIPNNSKNFLQRIFTIPVLRQLTISITISHFMINILVTGANGQLGQSFQYWAPDFVDFKFYFYDLPELNLLDHKQLEYFFNRQLLM